MWAHKIGIELVKQGKELNNALSFLRSCSSNTENRVKLRADGLLGAVIPYLKCLEEKKNEDDIRNGFRTASIIARLAGNDELGEGVTLLRGNPIVIEEITKILNLVLDAGSTGSVYGMVSKSVFFKVLYSLTFMLEN